MIPLLAHGALGAWDEVIFIGVAVIFTGLMIQSWRKSQEFEPELEDHEGKPQSSNPDE